MPTTLIKDNRVAVATPSTPVTAEARPKHHPDDPDFTQRLMRGFIKARGIAIAQNKAFDEAEKAKLEAAQS
jgi:hypothetical protein